MLKVKLTLAHKPVKLRQLSSVCNQCLPSWQGLLIGKGIMTPGWMAWTPAKQVLCNHWLGYLFDVPIGKPVSISLCILLYIVYIKKYHVKLIDTWVYLETIKITFIARFLQKGGSFGGQTCTNTKCPLSQNQILHTCHCWYLNFSNTIKASHFKFVQTVDENKHNTQF